MTEPEYREELGGFSVWFYKDIYNEENLKKMGLNERQIKAVLYVKERRRITNKEYRELNSVFNKTAYLELLELVKKDVFVSKGKCRNIEYGVMKK